MQSKVGLYARSRVFLYGYLCKIWDGNIGFCWFGYKSEERTEESWLMAMVVKHGGGVFVGVGRDKSCSRNRSGSGSGSGEGRSRRAGWTGWWKGLPVGGGERVR